MKPRERPIIFTGESVRAILDGRKTITRRVIKPQPGGAIEDCYHRPDGRYIWLHLPKGKGVGLGNPFKCPYGKPGDRLWVRETFGFDWKNEPFYKEAYDRCREECGYPPKLKKHPCWKPSIYMRREYSRILLEIENIRAERVQDISEEDAWAEGVNFETASEHHPACNGTEEAVCECVPFQDKIL